MIRVECVGLRKLYRAIKLCSGLTQTDFIRPAHLKLEKKASRTDGSRDRGHVWRLLIKLFEPPSAAMSKERVSF